LANWVWCAKGPVKKKQPENMYDSSDAHFTKINSNKTSRVYSFSIFLKVLKIKIAYSNETNACTPYGDDLSREVISQLFFYHPMFYAPKKYFKR
jgi:hypothetical protein